MEQHCVSRSNNQSRPVWDGWRGAVNREWWFVVGKTNI